MSSSREPRTSGRYRGVNWNGHSWEARFADTDGSRRSQAGFPSAKAAHDFRTAKLEAVRVEKLRRDHLPAYVDNTAGTMTLGELFDSWLAEQNSRRPLARSH